MWWYHYFVLFEGSFSLLSPSVTKGVIKSIVCKVQEDDGSIHYFCDSLWALIQVIGSFQQKFRGWSTLLRKILIFMSIIVSINCAILVIIENKTKKDRSELSLMWFVSFCISCQCKCEKLCLHYVLEMHFAHSVLLKFCWSSVKRLDLSRWIKLCTCFESLICVSLPKVICHYFAVLSFTIFGNMVQS